MRDTVLEAYLLSMEIRFKYLEKVPIDRIIVDKLTEFNIRLVRGLNEERVGMYTIEYEQGTEFPALLLWPHPSQPDYYLLINGLHRLKAIAGMSVPLQAHDAYVVVGHEDDEALLDLLRRHVNTLQGEPQGVEERTEHALHLFQKLGWTMKNAAAKYGLGVSRLQNRVSVERLRPRLAGQGVDLVRLKLSTSQLALLNPIVRDTDLAQVAGFVSAVALSMDEIKNLVKDVGTAQRHPDGVATLLSEWRAKYKAPPPRTAGRPRPSRSRGPLRRLLLLCRQVRGVLEESLGREANAMAPTDLGVVVQDVRKTQSGLARTAGLLERLRLERLRKSTR